MVCFAPRSLMRQSELEAMLKKAELTEFKVALLGLQSRIRGDVQQLTKEALDRNDGGATPRVPRISPS